MQFRLWRFVEKQEQSPKADQTFPGFRNQIATPADPAQNLVEVVSLWLSLLKGSLVG